MRIPQVWVKPPEISENFSPAGGIACPHSIVVPQEFTVVPAPQHTAVLSTATAQVCRLLIPIPIRWYTPGGTID
jgi:hypothetical protein